jgi:hypothetical protein
MNIYQHERGFFRHIIAAASREEAQAYIIRALRNDEPGIVPLVEIVAPDPLTRRTANEATVACEIDTIPIFCVGDGFDTSNIDLDDIPMQCEADVLTELRTISETHAEWIDALSNPRGYLVKLATSTEPTKDKTRTLAAAFGLGPIPEWLAPVLPAVLAIDHEATTAGAADWEGDLAHYDASYWRGIRIPTVATSTIEVAMFQVGVAVQVLNVLGPDRATRSMREMSRRALQTLGWIERGAKSAA